MSGSPFPPFLANDVVSHSVLVEHACVAARSGVLDRAASRRPSVRIKSGVNMVTIKELAVTRLVKEGRNWPRAETQQAKVPASLQWWDSACELGAEDGLRPGVLDRATSRRPSVRIKSGVNMVAVKELAVTRLVKEGRNWPRAETQQAKVPASLQWWDSACEPGVLDRITSRRPSVRIKSGVNMVAVKELAVTRLVKEGRNWPRAETQQAKVPASLQWWDSACEISYFFKYNVRKYYSRTTSFDWNDVLGGQYMAFRLFDTPPSRFLSDTHAGYHALPLLERMAAILFGAYLSLT
ncbi:hypothetical protein M514_19575 [Trichuris suis]|uniref:Uncharacterized protein n=1 Tax=Trichuris suis TaxID=68888 RepID=A0A085NFR7_9BILA|nr:hypothetical protein M514_19575 [Trichuris suis]